MARIISLIRYRFFLFAGIFPYFLGQALANFYQKYLDWNKFWLGFLGIFFALCGVELFNEYFDAREGGDRIFSVEITAIPRQFYALGILSLGVSFCIGSYLALRTGWPILLFSFLGFMAAYFYVGPPLKWAYRGLGEIIIALSYGPFMLLGSYYLQTRRIDLLPFFVSLICALIIFCLAIINEIPDYYQDKLSGKRNLVVKLGKGRAILLLNFGLLCVFFLISLGIIFKKLPVLSAAVFLIIPWVFKSLSAVQRNYDEPKVFLPAINANIIIYLVVISSLGIGYGFIKN